MSFLAAALVVEVLAGGVRTEYRVDASSPDDALAQALRFEDTHGPRFAAGLGGLPAGPAHRPTPRRGRGARMQARPRPAQVGRRHLEMAR